MHLQEWCDRHGYRDHTVTDARCTRFFMELLGEIDPSQPNYQPLRKKKVKDDGLGDLYMPETVDFYVKGVVDLWTQQNQSAPVAGAQTSPRKLAKPFMDAYKRRIGK